MTNDEYFKANRYQAKYEFGARVQGKFGKIPFVGSVGSDSVRNDTEEPHCTVSLALPIKIGDKVYNNIRVPTKSLKVYK
jgi:hypothetical protein